MDSISTINSFNEKNTSKIQRNNSMNTLFKIPINIINHNKKKRSYSFTKDISGYLSKIQSSKILEKKYFSSKSQKKIRKDIYGNIIKKGGNHKISFLDNFRGKYLVEMTLIDVKQNSLRGKNYKNLTVMREASDKEELFCSGVCNIF